MTKPTVKELAAQWKRGKLPAVDLVTNILVGKAKCQSKEGKAAVAFLMLIAEKGLCNTCQYFGCICGRAQ